VKAALVLALLVAGCSSAPGNGYGAGGTWDGGAGSDGSSADAGDTSLDDAGDASLDGSIADAADAAWSCDPATYPLPNEGLMEAPGQGGCSLGMLRVDTFCVDRFEASLELITPVGGVTSWSPYENPGSTPVRAVSIEGAVPQAYINADQAEAACQAAGKHLCTDTEWLRACQGAAGNTYPYGNTRIPGVCNDARSEHPIIELFGMDASFTSDELNDPCVDQLPDSLDLCGANAQCVSADGLYDMMGNLHEWTSDPAGTFRGGYYVDTVINGQGCLYVTTAHNRSYWDYSTGFRCCTG